MPIAMPNGQAEHAVPLVNPGPVPDQPAPEPSMALLHALMVSVLTGLKPPYLDPVLATPEDLDAWDKYFHLVADTYSTFLSHVATRLEAVTPGLELAEPHKLIDEMAADVCGLIDQAREKLIDERYEGFSRGTMAARRR